MQSSFRILVVFLKNRCRSKLSLSGLRRLVVLVLFVAAVYGFVYYSNASEGYESILRTYTEGYPGSITGITEETRSNKLQAPVQAQKRSRRDEVHPKVLLLYTSNSLQTAEYVKIFLESQRIDFSLYRHTVARQPILTVSSNGNGKEVGKFSLIIMTDMVAMFSNWTMRERAPYLNYCRTFNISLIFLTQLATDKLSISVGKSTALNRLRTRLVYAEAVEYLELNSSHKFYYAKPGKRITKILPNTVWQVFEPIVHLKRYSHTTTEQEHISGRKSYGLSHMTSHVHNVQGHVTSGPSHVTGMEDSGHHTSRRLLQIVERIRVTQAPPRKKRDTKKSEVELNFVVLLNMRYFKDSNSSFSTSPVVTFDRGKLDGVRKVFVGGPITFWLMKLLLLDVIRSLASPPVLRFWRQRWVMVDIDDAFVAPIGRKMTPDDVQALVESQQQLRSYVPGFTFNLGFCGRYYRRGTADESAGDQELVNHTAQFWWFDHTFHHLQPHNVSEDKLRASLMENVAFAKLHSIPAFTNHYGVSPHHSGIYPILPRLYHAWNTICNITVATTEEYPHLRPDHMRRGFIHRGIMVIPRQTCRLFTHTFKFSHFRGGKEQLLSFAEGGDLFDVLLSNPVSVFMTHTPNYAHDRLAPVLFDALFSFVKRWTQLNIVTDRPLTLGKKYFEIFPEDRMPVWTSPCKDKRHMDIWPVGRNCSRLPSLLILGPQKSGSTALYSFLKLHRNVVSNRNTQDHFEEVQFFSNDTIYQYGIDWYMDQFPYPESPSQKLFEKSATYLTHPLAPLRVHTLLPEAKLIIILQDPIKRAYSWYQHMIAHDNPAATENSFSNVIRSRAASTSNRRVLSLRSQCLLPGEYHQHISKWLEYFPPKQLMFVDGDELVKQPALVMDSVQKFLKIPEVNYWKLLKYDKKKGFYCSSDGGRPHCLGPSKGRHYSPMPESDRSFLRTYYATHNSKLLNMLRELSRAPPHWLNETFSSYSLPSISSLAT